jgi:hypothetical protein
MYCAKETLKVGRQYAVCIDLDAVSLKRGWRVLGAPRWRRGAREHSTDT